MTLKEFIQRQLITNLSDIAREIQCTPQFLSMIANGKRKPSYKKAKEIEKATNGKVKTTNWYK